MEKRGGGGEGGLTREDHHDDEKPPPPPRKPATTSSLPSRDALASMFKSSHLDTSPPPPPLSPSRSARHVPKVQSNLLKSPTRASPASTAASKTSASKIEVAASRDELVDWVGERERHLVSMKNEYEKHYVEYKQLVVKFYTEKLNNLKHSFKNQILKQKIYFETEMLELTREYWSDFEKQQKQQNSSSKSNSPKSNKKSNNNSNINKNKESKNKQLIKLLKDDLRTLVEYMRESLIQSSDTLIEAYETCECLKRLEKTETSISRQYTAMRESTQNLLNKDKKSKTNDDNNEETKQRDEEQARMDKYKSDLDELMNTLDDIELCHLQRKETLGGCCKLAAKLKSKFKFVESKYETLSRQVAALKFESYVYRELWAEKLRSDQQHSASNMRSASRSTSTSSLVDVDCDVSSQCPRDEFIVIGASSSSSSSSMMSNHEHQNDTVEHLIPLIDEFDLSDSNSTSSSDDDASSSDSAASDLPNENLRNMGENETSNESKSSSSSSLPASDYNRKLALITDLINLHKSKSSSYNTTTTNTNNDVWYNNSTTTTTQQSPQKPSSKERQNSPTSTRRRQSQQQQRILHHSHHRSSLGLIECSYEGDRVSVENCDLRRDCDLTGWLLERRIDGLVDVDEELVVVESTLPASSVVRSGKALCILQPFGRRHNHIEEILTALKLASSAPLTITTRLLTPDRIPVAAHTQEVPHFYREIFKYANLIHFVS